MKTSILMTSLLVLCSSLCEAQTPSAQTTVRIKTIERINGVETIRDTTYTSDSPQVFTFSDSEQAEKGLTKVILKNMMDSSDHTIKNKMEEWVIKDTSTKQVSPKINIVKRRENCVSNWPLPSDSISLSNLPTLQLDELIRNNDNALDMEGKTIVVKKVGKCNPTKAEIDSVKEEIHVFVVSRIRLADANDAELKKMGSTLNPKTSETIRLFPNPNNGQFTLSFELKTKTNVLLSIINAEGRVIYTEERKGFSGQYSKEMDLSSHPKGTYFIKLLKGSETEVKKIVLE